jgi:hypothetical protein
MRGVQIAKPRWALECTKIADPELRVQRHWAVRFARLRVCPLRTRGRAAGESGARVRELDTQREQWEHQKAGSRTAQHRDPDKQQAIRRRIRGKSACSRVLGTTACASRAKRTGAAGLSVPGAGRGRIGARSSHCALPIEGEKKPDSRGQWNVQSGAQKSYGLGQRIEMAAPSSAALSMRSWLGPHRLVLFERGSWLAWATVLAAAIALRFVGLDHLPGVNGDEAFFPVHAAEWRAGVPWSALRTGTNLPMNPVFFGLVALLQATLPTSFWTLRLSAVVHSLLAVAFGYWAFRSRGKSFAALFALLLAVLPIQLGYARLAWDPSAVTGVLVLSLAAATRGKLLLTGLVFAVALGVHPTAVFAAPVLLAAVLAARWQRAASAERRRLSPRRRALLGLSALSAAIAGSWFIARKGLPPPVRAALQGGLLDRMRERALSGHDALQFAQLYGDFISGPTIYRYVTGSMPESAARLHLLAAAVLLFAVVVPGLYCLRAQRRVIDAAVAWGLIASLILAYLVGGLLVLTPHTERYGMFLVAPSCYVFAAGADAWASKAWRGAAVRLAAALLGVLCLLSFRTHFLKALHRPDPERHNAFRTGPTDPKQRALAAILASRDAERLTLVRAEDWWIYWPVRYLAGERSDLHVTIAGARPDYRFPQDFAEPALNAASMELFGVAWAGSALDAQFAAQASSSVDIRGYGPEPILHVYHLPIDEAP